MIIQTTETQRHFHVVYVSSETGVGVTSIDKKHRHEVSVVLDDAGQLAGVEIAEAEGHTHDIAPFELVDPSEKSESDEDKAARVLTLYQEAKNEDGDYTAQAEISEKYYMSEQWSDSDKSKLTKEQRAALTINEIKPKIDLISGYQRQIRTNLRYKPFEGGDNVAADVLTRYSSSINDKSDYMLEEAEAFLDALITGRGNLHVYVDFTDNAEGEIRVERYNWNDVVYGPHEKITASDLEYCVKRKWLSLAKAKAMYPDKAQDMELMFEWATSDVKSQGTSFADDYESGSTVARHLDLISNMQAELFNLARKSVRVLELMYYDYTSVPVIFEKDGTFAQNLANLKADVVAKFKTIPGLGLRNVVQKTVKSCKLAGGVFLEESEVDLSFIPMVPIYATKRRHMVQGKVFPVIGLQDEVNKRHSQVTDIINRCAMYGVLFQSGAFAGKQQAKMEAEISKPGFCLEIADISKIKILEGIRFPAEVTQLYQISAEEMTRNMGLNAAALGAVNPNESAMANRQRRNQALIANQYLFDNLGLSKKRIGTLLAEAMVKFISPQRVFRVIGNQAVDPGAPNPEYSLEQIEQLWNVNGLHDLDVIVSEDPNAVTNRESNFAIWSDLLTKLQIPPQIALSFLVGLSDAPGKEKFLESLQAQQDSEESKELSAQEAEVQKSYPDDVKRMNLGLPPEGIDNTTYFRLQQGQQGAPAAAPEGSE